MKREFISLGMTVSILVSVLAFTQPTAAVLTTVSGPDTVTKHDPIEFEATVEIREDERVPIESFNLVIETDDGEAVTITFAPNGTLLEVTPDRGVVGEGEIRINQLRRSLQITPVASNTDFGYGYRSGTNERTGEDRSFGYGYGYGYGSAQPSFGFQVSMDSKAFKHGEYTVHLSVNTDGGEAVFTSNEKAFEVLVPAGIQPGDDKPDRAADKGSDDGEDEENSDADTSDDGADEEDDGEDEEDTDENSVGSPDDDRGRDDNRGNNRSENARGNGRQNRAN